MPYIRNHVKAQAEIRSGLHSLPDKLMLGCVMVPTNDRSMSQRNLSTAIDRKQKARDREEEAYQDRIICSFNFR